MIHLTIIRVVDFCARRHWSIIIAGTLLMLAAAIFDVKRFSINTDIESLISQDLPWHQRQIALFRAFPEKGITAVVTAPSAENAEQATNLLAQTLSQQPDLFPLVEQPDSGDFFERNGLLFKPLADVRKTADGLARMQPVIAALTVDPSLRGIAKTLSLATAGVKGGAIRLERLSWPLSLADRTLSDVLSGRPAAFSWLELLEGQPLPDKQRRHFLEVQPTLDFSALQPGRRAEEGFRRAAADLHLEDKFGATVALTGQVPMNDDRFAVIRTSAVHDTLTAAFGVLIILWLALRSWKLIAAAFFSLIVGLSATAALGLIIVSAFNLISIAFFVLFVGVGVDFGIQFLVRYRAERHEHPNLYEALRWAACKVGDPLSLAAAATAAGFLAFWPTNYRGLSELGLVAGSGMLIAFVCSVTLVPAALALLQPPGEFAPVGFRTLAPLDDFLQRHRIAVIAVTLIVILAGVPLLSRLTFDFNPVNLQRPDSPAVVTYRELQRDPESSGSDAELLTQSLGEADQKAKRLAALPEVSQALTLNSLFPTEQEQKIAALSETSQRLGPALNPPRMQPAPSDRENAAALDAAAEDLARAAGNSDVAAAASARHVSDLLRQLARSDAATRARAEDAFVPALVYDLTMLRKSLGPQLLTIDTLPKNLVRDWLSPDGTALVKAMPKGDPDDTNVLREFAMAVLRAEPSATGAAISLYESARTVTAAFVQAGSLAMVAITILLFIALRRVTDVLMTLIPLLLAGVVTLEIAVLAELSLNFANIIALPLLLGVGVAFKIYYVMAWRAGKTGLLQSTLTRAVIFSGMTTGTAFGSMWASSYPGMSSMGELMTIALLCTMAFAVLFQPVLMGQPRQVKEYSERDADLRQAAE
ncbi:hopanoid biosynthesis-associated RND transporter HpnN [Bradyrhizobium japonicum]|uniref:Hopanoid biosynthesis-associated RND transporter HpnN n=2 Tax=Bradyrhizobium japonicum TaxID=375 RepID=A0A1Y2JKG2_BRAJP|nr:hopanoid biosynthesis-associated RND transporter HpnN [Bradyrhizobium japonicum]